MKEVATSMTSARAGGPEGPSIDDLLQTGTFHQRLAAARAEREKALAARGDSGVEPQFLPGPKPWERPEYLRGEVRKVKREAPPPIALKAPQRAPATIPPAIPEAKQIAEIAASLEPIPVVEPAAAVRPEAPAPSRPRLYQVAGGVVLGLAIGVGMGFWFARAPQTEPASAIQVSASTPAAPTPGAGETAPLALPSVDVLPARASVPALPNASAASATLPAITGGGPVGPQMAAAPAAVAPGLVLPETSAPAPMEIGAPAASRQPAPALSGGAPELGFASVAEPLPVAFAVPRGAMPAVADGAQSLPGLPDTLSQPVSFEGPEAVAPAPGDQPLAAQGVPLPVARPAPPDGLKLIVHAPATLTDAEIGTASDAFAAAGFDTVEPKPVDFTIKETNVRFFSPADQADATRIAKALGAKLRDFTGFSPRPPEGTIEVWLAGRGNAAPAVSSKPLKSTKTKKVRSNGPSQVQILKDRLVRQLRAGILN